MAEEDIIAMSRRELRRIVVIQEAIDKKITQSDAADILHLCERQVRRIIARVGREGEAGIIHRSRGRLSHRARPPDTKSHILSLCRTKYKGFGPTFTAEKLFEINKLHIDHETLRGWFIEAGIDYKRRKAQKHRCWRPRKDYYGQMIQMDGSHHGWFEGRGPKCVLMGYIDDATGSFFGRFYGFEGTIPAMDSFRLYIKRYGIPQSVYLDNHSTYKSTKRPTIEDELANQKALSQMETVFEDLGVDVIHADSPQAKGRIERSFGTHQDRLIKEMRLAGIRSVQDANRFLSCYYIPKHNKKFTIPAKNKANLHRPIPKSLDLDRVFCIRSHACLRNDFTVRFDNIYYQILDSLRAKTVTIEQRLNGKLCIYHKDRELRHKRIDKRPQKPQEPTKPRYSFGGRRFVPPKDHPYRLFRKFRKKCA